MMSSARVGVTPGKRVESMKPSVWVYINQEVAKYQPVNLGQGFPDCKPLAHLMNHLRELTDEGANPLFHQYTRSMGHVRLVRVLANIYTRYTCCPKDQYTNSGVLTENSFAPDRQIDPLNEVIITVGAYGSLYAAILSTIDDGDEVIVMDPSFDCYDPMVRLAGGVPIHIPLRPVEKGTVDQFSDDWRLDMKELQSKISPRTKMIILNTPHNPLGKVFDLEELEALASVCIRHNLLCVSDEVYEWIVYPPKKHIKIASLPGMWSRTLTIGSAGKTFSVTGWKLGWTIGPAHLIHGMQLHQQNTVYTCATPLQEAFARSLEVEHALLGTRKSYFSELAGDCARCAEQMADCLRQVGMTPVLPSGGYFMVADISKLKVPPEELESDEQVTYDCKFNNWMMRKKGLAAIPLSVFYATDYQEMGSKLIRFCFYKTDETMEKAFQILKNW